VWEYTSKKAYRLSRNAAQRVQQHTPKGSSFMEQVSFARTVCGLFDQTNRQLSVDVLSLVLSLVS